MNELGSVGEYFDFPDGVRQRKKPKEKYAISTGHHKNISTDWHNKHAEIKNPLDPVHKGSLALGESFCPIWQARKLPPYIANGNDSQNDQSNRLVPVVQRPLRETQGSYRLGELTPDSFKQSDYYINHYQQLGLNEEVGIFVDLPDGDYMVISMGRQDGYSSITRTERNVLTSTFPVIRSLVREFWQQHSDSILETDKNQNRLENAFLSFGKGLLTPREQEISSLILQGHSSKSVANELGISAGTVKVHRKNIYTRLNISTQSQLFSRFLTHLESQATSLNLV